MLASKVQGFFVQPITLGTLARDGLALFSLCKLFLVAAVAVLLLVHIPALAFAGMGLLALSNGRFFSTAIAFVCAYAWAKWLWGFLPLWPWAS